MSSPKPQSYAVNILWSWLGVVTLLLSGIFFTRILILDLGKDRFGLWVIATSLVEYVWMIDLGFRPATVKLSAEYRALARWDDLNSLINTAVAYSCAVGSIIGLSAWFGADYLATFYTTEPAFPSLIRMVGLSWAAGLAFNIFAATTEGFQRFDLSNRTAIVTTLVRGSVSVALVHSGYGLREMGWTMLGAQVLGYAMMYRYCIQVYPQLHFSTTLIRWSTARSVLSYARQVIPGIIGTRFAQGSMPSIIALNASPTFVTYYAQAVKLADYAADAISRVGLVTAPRVAEWEAQGKRQEIVNLTRTANRYCVTLWGLWASFLWVCGIDLLRIWIDAELARNVMAILPFFLIAYTLFMGQFISAAVLMGIARYQVYSLALLAEALLSVAVMSGLLPTFGFQAGVAGVCTLLAITRCGILSYLFSKEFGISQLQYLRHIFARPLLLIGGGTLLLTLVRPFLPAQMKLWQLAIVGVVFAVPYAAIAFFSIVDPRHRDWFKAKATRVLGQRFA